MGFETTGAYVGETNLFAVKSGAQTTVDGQLPGAMEIGPEGPMIRGVPDRWAVAAAILDDDPADHEPHARMVSQRGYGPRTKAINYPGDSQLTLVQNDIVGPGELRVTVPGAEPFTVRTRDALGKPLSRVRIHPEDPELLYYAADLGDKPADALTNFLAEATPDMPRRDIGLFGAPLVSGIRQRLIRPEYRVDDASHTVYGADGAAILMVNAATLRYVQEVNGYDDEYLGMLRARANLVLEGLEPGDEYRIAAIKIGDLVLRSTGPSSRCVETGVDPETGERDNNRFLSALAKAGQRGWSSATGDSGSFFGTNMQPNLKKGERAPVGIGDRVEIEWLPQPNILKTKPAKTPA